MLGPVTAKHEIADRAVAAPDEVAFSRVANEEAGQRYAFWAFFAPGEAAIAKQLFGLGGEVVDGLGAGGFALTPFGGWRPKCGCRRKSWLCLSTKKFLW